MLRNTIRLLVVAIPLLTASCGNNPVGPVGPVTPAATCPATGVAASYTLSATGITVEIQSCPYSYSVVDGSGKTVLSTSDAHGGGDGWGALGYTSGTVSWQQLASPGYTGFSASLDPWRDRWEVVSVEGQGTDHLDVTLAAPAHDPSAVPATTDASLAASSRIVVHHQLRASTLRVEASLPTGAADAPPRAFAASFASPADEGFLGLGERFNRTNQRGKRVYAWTEEGGLGQGEKVLSSATNPYPNGEEMTYYPVPFFISTKGYGFWLDSTWRNQFDLAPSDDNGSGQAYYSDAWRIWHIGPSLKYEVYVPIPNDARPWTHHLLDLFTQTTGRPMVAPEWGFGPRRRINNNSVVNGTSEIQAMRDLDLAITAADDAEHFLPNAGETNRQTQLAAWTKAARALGYRPICYYNSLFTKGDTNPLKDQVDTALANHWFLADATGTAEDVWLISGGFTHVYQVDFTSDAATAWYQTQFKRAIDIGYSGWMYDFGEYVQADMVASNKMTGEELHNLYPMLYDKAGHDGLEAGPLKGDWFFFARSGYTGSSQYTPVVWSGDPTASFEDALGLPAMVRAGVNMGMSGVPHWGSDIGGYKCIPDGTQAADGELLARWIEMGSVSGDMHDEDSCSQGTGPKASIWTSTDAQAAWKTYARLHTRLFPYLYTYAQEAHKTGAPLMRHMFFEHPDGADLSSVDDQYYLGPALLAAPVVKRGDRQKAVKLPPGNYLDWQDQKLFVGGQTTVLDAPLAKLPLLLRDGYLIPLLDPTIDTLDDGDHAGVVGPKEVAGVYDVVALISKTVGQAALTLYDGSMIAASWSGGFVPGNLTLAPDEATLSTCSSCYRKDDLGSGLSRVRISMTGNVDGGGLKLTTTSTRKLRWDLYVLE